METSEAGWEPAICWLMVSVYDMRLSMFVTQIEDALCGEHQTDASDLEWFVLAPWIVHMVSPTAKVWTLHKVNRIGKTELSLVLSTHVYKYAMSIPYLHSITKLAFDSFSKCQSPILIQQLIRGSGSFHVVEASCQVSPSVFRFNVPTCYNSASGFYVRFTQYLCSRRPQ